MKHDEFMRELCMLISEFSLNMTGNSGPCFCGENEISRREREINNWHWDGVPLKEMKRVFNLFLISQGKREIP